MSKLMCGTRDILMWVEGSRRECNVAKTLIKTPHAILSDCWSTALLGAIWYVQFAGNPSGDPHFQDQLD